MKLSTRTRYGIRAMVELARHYDRGALRLKSIAQRQDISVKYLEHLMAILKAAGLVISIRGAKGGYVLPRPPEEITLDECFNCLEGPVVTVECVANDNYCTKQLDCAAHGVWVQMDRAIHAFLESQSLYSLAEKSKKTKVINYNIQA